ncbi:MAG: membrane protein insertase YidC [Gemmatimonadetes bacterium]|nr:membrane protein insertase YidC [Gemmatimonadota bacterium]
MERRFFLALLLTGIVLLAPAVLFPPPPRPTTPVVPAVGDTGAVMPSVVPVPGALTTPTNDGRTARRTGETAGPSVAPVRPETVVVGGERATYRFSSVGAVPLSVELTGYRALNGDRGEVVVRDRALPLLSYTMVTGADTVRWAGAPFTSSTSGSLADPSVRFVARDGSGTTVRYVRTADEYLTDVRVTVPGASGRSYLLVGLPSGFVSHEADSVEDSRYLSYAAKPVPRSAKGVAFSSLDPGERELVAGPLSWAVAKNKYFLVGLLSPSDSTPFSELQAVGGPRESRMATRGTGTVVMPLVDGEARFTLYIGPQSWERMRGIGREFETANPYGGWFQGMVQPFSIIVMKLMLWLKRVVQLDYGWVLVIFGLGIRILLWPLNQSAMRSSIRMQRLQPEIMAVQAQYKSDPQRLQQEMMKVYQSHGMSPLAPLAGCIPMLIPMPVFFALFFVFQNTIEFRDVPFLWLGDISLKDPLYILPIVTGLSMYLMSWIGMRNMPPNPQAKILLYLMPAMFTVFLLNTASGLSIYYLVQQIAAIPQQWLIANERQKAQVVPAKAK